MGCYQSEQIKIDDQAPDMRTIFKEKSPQHKKLSIINNLSKIQDYEQTQLCRISESNSMIFTSGQQLLLVYNTRSGNSSKIIAENAQQLQFDPKNSGNSHTYNRDKVYRLSTLLINKNSLTAPQKQLG